VVLGEGSGFHLSDVRMRLAISAEENKEDNLTRAEGCPKCI
jgi:hypothetical protein